MTDLLLLCIFSALKPDLENQLFSLVGVLLRVVFVILVVAPAWDGRLSIQAPP